MSNNTYTLFTLIAMLAIFYAIMFIPESRRKKKFNAMINSLKINDEIITRGGLVGKIVGMQDEFLTIQTGPDKVKIKITKSAVANVTTVKSEEVSDKK
jgi:preprotein translocase subunit YajC